MGGGKKQDLTVTVCESRTKPAFFMRTSGSGQLGGPIWSNAINKRPIGRCFTNDPLPGAVGGGPGERAAGSALPRVLGPTRASADVNGCKKGRRMDAI